MPSERWCGAVRKAGKERDAQSQQGGPPCFSGGPGATGGPARGSNSDPHLNSLRPRPNQRRDCALFLASHLGTAGASTGGQSGTDCRLRDPMAAAVGDGREMSLQGFLPGQSLGWTNKVETRPSAIAIASSKPLPADVGRVDAPADGSADDTGLRNAMISQQHSLIFWQGEGEKCLFRDVCRLLCRILAAHGQHVRRSGIFQPRALIMFASPPDGGRHGQSLPTSSSALT